MQFKIECEREEDGRSLAEVVGLPGALAYGHTRDEAIAKAEALGLRVIVEDPDAGLELRPEIIESLLQQEKDFAAGKRGKSLDQVAKELGLGN